MARSPAAVDAAGGFRPRARHRGAARRAGDVRDDHRSHPDRPQRHPLPRDRRLRQAHAGHRSAALARACPTTTAGRRGCARWPRTSATCARAGARAASTRRRVARDRLRGARHARRRHRALPQPTPTPTWRRCCTTSCSRASPATRQRKPRAGALDFLDLLIRARDLVRDVPDGPPRVPGAASASFSSTSSRTPIRCRPTCSGCSPPTSRRTSPATRSICRCAGRAVHRRRSEAVDLPVPPRRRRRLSPRLPAADRARRPARVTLQTSFRSVPHIQRAVNAAFSAAHDRRRRVAAGRLRRAAAVSRRSRRTSRRSWRCRCRGRTAARTVTRRPSPSRCPRRSASSCAGSSHDSGWRVPDGRGGERGRSRPATSACCSAASSTTRTT